MALLRCPRVPDHSGIVSELRSRRTEGLGRDSWLTECTTGSLQGRLENLTPANHAQLMELAPKFAIDGQTITAYIQSQCD